MCSHSLKMPSDKSHKTDHKHGRSHFVHKSFLIFTSDVQPVLSRPRCAATPHQSLPPKGSCKYSKGNVEFPSTYTSSAICTSFH